MVAETRARIAEGMTAEAAAVASGFTNYAQYWNQARRMGVNADSAEKRRDWVPEYTVAPLPKMPDETLAVPATECVPKPVTEFDLRPDPKAHYCILLDQMRLVQELSRACIVAVDMVALSDVLIRLAEEITD